MSCFRDESRWDIPRELEARQARSCPDIDDKDEGRCPDETGGHHGVFRRHPLEKPALKRARNVPRQDPAQASRLGMTVVRLQQHRGEAPGSGVSETKQEITVEAAMVVANLA